MTRQEAELKLARGMTQFSSEQMAFNRMLVDALERLGMLGPEVEAKRFKPTTSFERNAP